MKGVRLVGRPQRVVGRPPIYPIAELLKTADLPARALRIPFGARRPRSVVAALHKAVGRRGFRLRHQRRKHYLLAWVEKATA